MNPCKKQRKQILKLKMRNLQMLPEIDHPKKKDKFKVVFICDL